MARELNYPDFLKESTKDVHNRMLSNAPDELNKVEGDFLWDNTQPAASDIAKMKNLDCQYILKQAFPATAEKPYLDLIGEPMKVYRRKPLYSKGYLRIVGKLYTEIPKGSTFYTKSSIEGNPIAFITLDDGLIVDEFTDIRITAVEPGNIGNVAKNSITIPDIPISGITEIFNPEPTTGGIDEEDDDTYRLRIEAADNGSFVGNISDYERWAQEIQGVGKVYVEAETPREGHTTLFIMDLNGDVANEDYLKQVQEHICPQPWVGDGLAPCNANIHVLAPEILKVKVEANFIFEESVDKEEVIKELEKRIDIYLRTLEIKDTILFKGIESIIGEFLLYKKGIVDYKNLLVNGGTENIILGFEVARLDEVIVL